MNKWIDSKSTRTLSQDFDGMRRLTLGRIKFSA